MGPGTFLPVTLTSTRNVTAYAVRGDDGSIRVAVIEKDDTATGPVHVDLRVGGRGNAAEIVHLTGPSLTGAQGIAIQGASVDRRGRLDPGRPDRVRVHGGVLGLDLAAGSAVVITLNGPRGG
jgi:hypothetical protein